MALVTGDGTVEAGHWTVLPPLPFVSFTLTGSKAGCTTEPGALHSGQ